MLTDHDAADDPPVRQLEREDRGAPARADRCGTTWPDLVGHWGDDWHVLAPDLRGHGQSPRFTEDELAMAPEVLLADVVTVVDGQPEPVALVGHSLGGLLALRAALARPDRTAVIITELILAAPVRAEHKPMYLAAVVVELEWLLGRVSMAGCVRHGGLVVRGGCCHL